MFRKSIVTLLFALAFCSGAQAQAYRVVPSGGTIKLLEQGSINPDCSSAGRPTVRTIEAPQHGRLTVTYTSVFLYFRESNPRSACNRRRVPGVMVQYTTQRGYVGYDSLSFEIFFANGQAGRGTYNIQVR